MDDLLPDFLIEANESLAKLDVALVQLERSPGEKDTLSLIFREVHTIKGTCGFLGLKRLEKVAHAAENVLCQVRDGLLAVTSDIISLVLEALDAIKAIVTALGDTGDEPAGGDGPLIARLNSLAALSDTPDIAIETITHLQVEAVAVAAPPPAPAAEAHIETTPPEVQSAAQTIRVSVEVLEELMTLVGELVLTRNQLLQIARTQEMHDDKTKSFSATLQRLSQITSDLQEGVMKTRMQPIGNASNKLPRLVRDLARDLDKKIELVMVGQETELDRQVLEQIKDPLTHMVRNSGDHGLESPAERRAAGKPETGRITLNAFHEGGHIIIEISDDGRGLAVGSIRKKALAQGLHTEAELAAMSENQIQRIIFLPGFSTAAAITAVSGRGVGMDVVKTNIERIGGTIDLKSVAGQGTVFTITIPLTLAIVAALIVEAAGERFAVPQISVLELVRVGNAGGPVIEHLNGTPVLRLRERLLPLLNLRDLLQLGDDEQPRHDTSVTVVVVAVGSNIVGIIVDRVFDTEEIVVKPVAQILSHITMFSGNTILGDGAVVMILDPNGIARAAGMGAAGESKAQSAAVESVHSADSAALLLFRAGPGAPKAVPLGLVARIEDIPREKIEISGGMLVTQYRGKLMPLIPLDTDGALDERSHQAVLVFTDRERSMGLMVDEIVDAVQERLHIELGGTRPGLLGTAVIAGHATDVIDTGYWLTRAWRDWFGDSPAAEMQRPRVLVVEDSDFFRKLLVPVLSAAGYDITAAAGAGRALALREAGAMFDVIVSDIEMPDMDGMEFARHVREAGPWSELPLIALTGRTSATAAAASRNAGFTDYIVKFERDALLGSLRQCLSAQTQTVKV